MPFSITWNEAYPAGTDNAGAIEDYFHQDKIATRERMESLLGISNFATRFPMSADALRMDGAANTYIKGGTATWSIRDTTGVTSFISVNTVTGTTTLLAVTTGLINGQTINATANFTGTLNVADDFSVATNKLTIDGATGNLISQGSASFTTGEFSSTVQIGAATGASTLTLGTTAPSGNSTALVKFINSNSTINWQISTNTFTANAFEFTPSTAGGGSTFTTPVVQLTTATSFINNALALAGDLSVATTKFTVAAATGNTTIAGTALISGVATFTLPWIVSDANVAGARTLTIKNTNTGGSGYASITVQNDARLIFLAMFSGGFTSYGTNFAGGASLITDGAGGLSIGTIAAGVSVRVYSGNILAGTFYSSPSIGLLLPGLLEVSSDLKVNSTKFVVTASSGNTSVAGTLGVTGNLTINTNKFAVTAASGDTLVAGVMAIAGAAISASTGMVFPVGTTALSSLRIPHGAAPTTPVNGDVWTTTVGLFIQINGVTKTVTLT